MKFDFERKERIEKRKSIVREIVVWIVEIAFVVGLAFVLIRYGAEKTTMVGNTMENTLKNGDKIIINKFVYRFTKPRRFDIIVFKQNGKEHSYYNIKRVVGLPGETVQIKDGKIYIDGKLLDEKTDSEPVLNSGLAERPVRLDEKEYFVLGDNRNNSEDSRYANIGNVVSGDIIGKAWISLSPFRFLGRQNTKAEPSAAPETTPAQQ